MSIKILCNVCDSFVDRNDMGIYQFADECRSCYEKRMREQKDFKELKEIMQRLMKK